MLVVTLPGLGYFQLISGTKKLFSDDMGAVTYLRSLKLSQFAASNFLDDQDDETARTFFFSEKNLKKIDL